MAGTKSFKMQKGYEGTALHGQTVTWSVPTTVQEALAAGPDTNGKPYFESEAALVATAVAQLNIKKGHAISGKLESLKEGETLSLADAEQIARVTVQGERAPRGEGGGAKAKKELGAKVQKATADLTTKSDAALEVFLSEGLITQEAYDAEKARRQAAQPQTARRAAK